MAPSDPARLLPLKHRVYLMLVILTEGPRHGYALKEEVARRTAGRMNLGPGTLYRTIRSMLEDGLTSECDGPRDESDERRRYYRITGFGRRVLLAETERLAQLVATVKARDLGTD